MRGLQEKQYQLAAQKRHEANLKHNYYKETVKFFARENENNKQFNSWCSNEISPVLEKSLKAQQLSQRQLQLKSIFQKEQEQYEKELLELKSRKNQQEDYSIKALEHKLKEKKAEQSLYLPKDCRRFQSYFYNTRSPSQSLFNKKISNSEIIFNDSCSDNSGSSKEKYNQSPEKSPSSIFDNSTNIKTHQAMYQSQLLGSGIKQALYENTIEKPIQKFFTKPSCKSLEETNIRSSNESSMSTRSSNCRTPLSSNEETRINNYDDINRSREFITSPQEISDKNQTEKLQTYVNNPNLSSKNSDIIFSKENSQMKDRNIFFDNSRENLSIRENPKYKNLTLQMFRYLANKDLQEQILNLSKREYQACRKQWWTQALRLREMKNKLELIREQNMYNTLFSHMDRNTKKNERHKITEKSTIISEREKICKNSSVYE